MQDNNQGMEIKKSNNPIYFGIFAIVILVVFAGFYFTSGRNKSENSPVALQNSGSTMGVQTNLQQNEEPQKTIDQMDNQSDVKIVDVEAGSFYYKPNIITVKKGEKVKIVMTSVDRMHDFNIDELGVKIPVTPEGKTASIEFMANTPGEFEYYCSVGNHRQMGQVGTLIVEE